MNFKTIGISALINAILTIALSLIFLPLSFLGPLIGGFLASYLSKGYEDYDEMNNADGAVLGGISGGIGGLIISLLFLLGIGDISTVTASISSIIGGITGGFIITGYIILELSIILSFVLGLVGGIIGVIVKK
ncbi:DUF5518 domain-containing protein [Methanobacterium sp. ACI-7]|uniref:DUF5518 domain-containing protein n=1 Tax=unclassified Methanobacterium TaxID=2627676 RepID=UPI0039C4DC97